MLSSQLRISCLPPLPAIFASRDCANVNVIFMPGQDTSVKLSTSSRKDAIALLDLDIGSPCLRRNETEIYYMHHSEVSIIHDTYCHMTISRSHPLNRSPGVLCAKLDGFQFFLVWQESCYISTGIASLGLSYLLNCREMQ